MDSMKGPLVAAAWAGLAIMGARRAWQMIEKDQDLRKQAEGKKEVAENEDEEKPVSGLSTFQWLFAAATSRTSTAIKEVSENDSGKNSSGDRKKLQNGEQSGSDDVSTVVTPEKSEVQNDEVTALNENVTQQKHITFADECEESPEEEPKTEEVNVDRSNVSDEVENMSNSTGGKELSAEGDPDTDPRETGDLATARLTQESDEQIQTEAKDHPIEAGEIESKLELEKISEKTKTSGQQALESNLDSASVPSETNPTSPLETSSSCDELEAAAPEPKQENLEVIQKLATAETIETKIPISVQTIQPEQKFESSVKDSLTESKVKNETIENTSGQTELGKVESELKEQTEPKPIFSDDETESKTLQSTPESENQATSEAIPEDQVVTEDQDPKLVPEDQNPEPVSEDQVMRKEQQSKEEGVEEELASKKNLSKMESLEAGDAEKITVDSKLGSGIEEPEGSIEQEMGKPEQTELGQNEEVASKPTFETTEVDNLNQKTETDLPDTSSIPVPDANVQENVANDDNDFEELQVTHEEAGSCSSSSSKFTIVDITEDDVIMEQSPDIDDSLLKSADESWPSSSDQAMTSTNVMESQTDTSILSNDEDVSTTSLDDTIMAEEKTVIMDEENEDVQESDRNVEDTMQSEEATTTPFSDVVKETVDDLCDSVEKKAAAAEDLNDASENRIEFDSKEKKPERAENEIKTEKTSENLPAASSNDKQKETTLEPPPKENITVPSEKASPPKPAQLPTATVKICPPEGPPPVCTVNLQLKLIHSGSRRRDDTAVIEDMDLCDFKLYIRNIEDFPAKIKAKIYFKIALRNAGAGLGQKKMKTKSVKPSSPLLSVNKMVEVGKVPRKMLRGNLQMALWSSGGMGGKKQICAGEINLNATTKFGSETESSWGERMVENKGKWLDATLPLR